MDKRTLLVAAGLAVILGITPARAQVENDDPAVNKALKDSRTLQSEQESAAPDADTSHAPQAQTSNGITFRTGGVGKDERDALLLVTKSYPLKVVLAGSGDAPFVADATIRVLDSAGKPLVEANGAGPLLFADVPSGTYQVEASLRGQAQKKSVTVTKGKQTPVSFTF